MVWADDMTLRRPCTGVHSRDALFFRHVAQAEGHLAGALGASAAQRRHQRTLVVFGVVTASAVALLLGHMRALQDELVQFKQEMTPLRTEVSHLKGNVAALLQGEAKVSAEQIGELLALRQEPAPAQTCAEYVPRPVVADSPL